MRGPFRRREAFGSLLQMYGLCAIFSLMAASFEFLRGVLGVLCVLFAHMAGRSAAAVRLGQQKISRLYAWALRAAACGVVLALRHSLDTIAIAVWVLAAAAFAAGWWAADRAPKEEDLTHQIFPE